MADPNTRLPLSRQSVLEAHKLIKPHIHFTPVLTNRTIDEIASTPQTLEALKGTEWEGKEPAKPKIRLWFKCENLQRVGAFKVRGAFHALKRLEEAEGGVDAGHGEGGWREKGVVTHSSGNHAQALALAARELKIPAHIVMPTISTPSKIAATKGYGAQVRFSGSTSVEREAMVEEVIKETGAKLVPPYDHPDIIAGQGTMGLELQEQVQKLQFERGVSGVTSGEDGNGGLNAIITPCGGGGMLSGVALSCQDTGILVFGAEPEFQGADDGKRGFRQGKRIESVKSLTIADGLRTPVGKLPWDVIYERGLVRDMFSVSEEQIRKAMRLVFERMKDSVEGVWLVERRR
ncbi:461f01e4-8c36-49df-ab66-9595600e8f04 [Sclerotinia trifoliorum]|uniref:461f01e4-8c36-49df-ab66-9595600e8f04 n=1 Tax=Sclerotinia trifoliorum TaxID=28548 RepID=A0A8H2W2X8_9HELO|nr:461f01e4-8c36-49df-ab66-9595600e8f04 [Sclerotinia trifoliorum]